MRDTAKYTPIEGDENEPVARGEFNEAMAWIATAFQELRGEMVTKNDLKQLATKDDLKSYATKNDLKSYATKSDIESILNDWGKTLFEKVDVAVEQRQIDLGAAKHETVEATREKVESHEKSSLRGLKARSNLIAGRF